MNIVETDRITGAAMAFGAAITDIRAVPAANGDTALFLLSGTGGGLTSYTVSPSGTLTLEQEVPHGSAFAPGQTPSLETLTLGGDPVLLMEAMALGGTPAYEVSNDGSLGPATPITGLSAPLSAVSATNIGGTDYIFAATGSGIASYSRTANGALTLEDTVPDSATTTLSDIRDSVTFWADDTPFLAVASAAEHGVSVFSIGPDGALTPTGDVGAADGIGMSSPNRIEAVSILGVTFLIVASPGSSGISVLRIGPDGAPVIADHVNDDLATRFQSVTNLDVLSHGDHAYVLVTGADSGFSLLTLLPNGRLIHRGSVADSVENALANASAASMWISGGTLHIAAAGLSDEGFSRFEVDISTLGSVSSGEGPITGTALDDTLAGSARDDAINGAGGDDILIDGAGTDTLTGGAGEDLFVLTRDGANDTITDFTVGTDKLDLSAFPLLYDVSQLDVTSTANGAILTFGGETVTLIRNTGAPIHAGDLTNADILNINRSPLMTIPMTLYGTAADDTLNGGEGDDTLLAEAGVDTVFAFGGADLVRAGTGNDTVHGGAGDDLLYGDAGFDTIYAGEGDDRVYGGAQADILYGDAGNDRLLGEDGVDNLYGGDGADELLGNAQNDYLFGGDGPDTLYGGTEEDRLFGEAGDDILYGEGGFDRLEGGDGDDVLDGGAQADNLFGQAGQDTLFGGGGFDRLFGGADSDDLFGGSDDDALFGEAGNDALDGGADDDRLYGGQGDDILQGGAGDDYLSGDAGFDTLIGGAGNDTLRGAFNADTFIFEDGFGQDTITDFDVANAYEKISLVAVSGITDWADLTANHIAQSGDDVIIDAGGGNTISLLETELGDLTAGDFLF